MEKDVHDERKLVEKLVGGSEAAFKVLFDKYRPRIYRLSMQYLKSPAMAQEVVQEVFMKLWVHREIIRVESPVEGWLVTVGKNNILNKLKRISNEWKAMNQLKKVHPEEDNSLQDYLNDADQRLLLNEALNCLSDKQLKVYTLARNENLSYIQIGEQLNISPLTVKTHMSRALGHIRVALTQTS